NQLRNQFEQEKSQLEQLNAQQQHNQNNLNLVNQDIQQWLSQHPDFQACSVAEFPKCYHSLQGRPDG
ncbi:MAG: hypothetical protein RR068_19035, partial [Hafnia sp.]